MSRVVEANPVHYRGPRTFLCARTAAANRELKSANQNHSRNPSLAINCDTQFSPRDRLVNSNRRRRRSKAAGCSDSHWNQRARVRAFTCGSPAELIDSAELIANRRHRGWQRCRRDPLRRSFAQENAAIGRRVLQRRMASTWSAKPGLRRSVAIYAIDPQQPFPQPGRRDRYYGTNECWRRGVVAQIIGVGSNRR